MNAGPEEQPAATAGEPPGSPSVSLEPAGQPESGTAPFPAAVRHGSVLGRIASGSMKWLVGALFSTFFLTSFAVVGWTARVARREMLKTWWRRSPARQRSVTFREFAANDPNLAAEAAWPNWILGSAAARPATSGLFSRLGRRCLGGLRANLGAGIPLAFNTAVLTLPGGLLWSVAWFAGWQNSFNKGYEHAWFGPSMFILGMLLFTAAMAYVPFAQARQASTGDWRRFYDFRLVWRLIRRHWLGSVGLALAWAAASGAVLLVKLAPSLAQYGPNLLELPLPEAVQLSNRFFLAAALVLFPLYVFIRLLAARLYAHALCSAYQAGAVTEDELGEMEWHRLRRLELLKPRPAPQRRWFVRLARWLATRTGQITAAAAVFLVWFGFSFLVTVSEFVAKTEFGRGWWNQPMIQLPWFDYTPQRLRAEAEKAKEASPQESIPVPQQSKPSGE